MRPTLESQRLARLEPDLEERRRGTRRVPQRLRPLAVIGGSVALLVFVLGVGDRLRRLGRPDPDGVTVAGVDVGGMTASRREGRCSSAALPSRADARRVRRGAGRRGRSRRASSACRSTGTLAVDEAIAESGGFSLIRGFNRLGLRLSAARRRGRRAAAYSSADERDKVSPVRQDVDRPHRDAGLDRARRPAAGRRRCKARTSCSIGTRRRGRRAGVAREPRAAVCHIASGRRPSSRRFAQPDLAPVRRSGAQGPFRSGRPSGHAQDGSRTSSSSRAARDVPRCCRRTAPRRSRSAAPAANAYFAKLDREGARSRSQRRGVRRRPGTGEFGSRLRAGRRSSR